MVMSAFVLVVPGPQNPNQYGNTYQTDYFIKGTVVSVELATNGAVHDVVCNRDAMDRCGRGVIVDVGRSCGWIGCKAPRWHGLLIGVFGLWAGHNVRG